MRLVSLGMSGQIPEALARLGLLSQSFDTVPFNRRQVRLQRKFPMRGVIIFYHMRGRGHLLRKFVPISFCKRVSRVFEVFQQKEFKCWQFPISFYSRASRC